jgi:hypothetical protein
MSRKLFLMALYPFGPVNRLIKYRMMNMIKTKTADGSIFVCYPDEEIIKGYQQHGVITSPLRVRHFQIKTNRIQASIAITKGRSFDWRITKEAAEQILKYDALRGTGIVLMCKEYGQDEEWVGLESSDLNDDNNTGILKLDDDLKTFELWV